jgi:hypothetical protein
MTPEIIKTAILSPCLTWRYELRRIWDESLPPYVLGGLNPSRADAEIDDMTVKISVGRARLLGCGSTIHWNPFAFRAKHPKDMKAAADPIGPENDAHIRRILAECKARRGIAVVGWGDDGTFWNRDRAVIAMAREAGLALMCLGTTKSRQPKHPLRISYETPLVQWRAA